MKKSVFKTYTPKVEEADKLWVVVDAADKVLGRLASEIAKILRGKHKPLYTPHLDMGDFVVVVNAEKVRVTGRKSEKKTYFRHSGYPGGVKLVEYKKLRSEKPEMIIKHAVRGMLPHNRLGRKMFKKLKVYAGPDHPHQAQLPESLEIG